MLKSWLEFKNGGAHLSNIFTREENKTTCRIAWGRKMPL